MRFVSLAAVLGAALLPAVNARPACRPDRSTTSGAAITAPTTTVASIETSSSDVSTALEASTTYETTSALETTIVVSATATSDSTALIPITTADTTSVEVTTTADETTSAGVTTTVAETTSAAEVVPTTTQAATTTTAAPAGPTNFVQNSGFEDIPDNVWTLQGSDIVNSPDLSHTGNQYLEISLSNNFAIGQNVATQTVSGLSTDRLYHLSLYSTVFSSPPPVIIPGTICFLQAQQGSSIIAQFQVDFATLDSYQPFGIDFAPANSDISLSLRLRCTNGRRVTLALGIDDVTIEPVFRS